jgi:hypothetical protein
MMVAQVQASHPHIGKPGKDVVRDTAPATAKIENMISVFDLKPFDQLTDHLDL